MDAIDYSLGAIFGFAVCALWIAGLRKVEVLHHERRRAIAPPPDIQNERVEIDWAVADEVYKLMEEARIGK